MIDPLSPFETSQRSPRRSLFLAGALLGWMLLAGACGLTSPNANAPTSAETGSVTAAGSSTGAAIGSCSLMLAEDISDEDAIRALLTAEGELVVAQEIAPLMSLWSDGGGVIDAKNTPDDDLDDQTWLDKDAIRHRYVRTVFPGAPDSIQPADLTVEIDGDHAVVRATTQIGDEVSPAGDRWELVKTGGCWAIERLVYNLESAE